MSFCLVHASKVGILSAKLSLSSQLTAWNEGFVKNVRLMAVAALVVSTGLAGCGSDPTQYGAVPADISSNKITGNVHEWGIDLSAGKATAGEVIFAITNFGTISHEFIVVKTDFPLGDIPVGSNNRLDEAGAGVKAIDEISEFEVDTSHVLKVKLAAGSYQLICNIAGHYKNGMHASLVVS